MVTLYRAQMARKAFVVGALDVTVKGASGFARPLAPTWDMVMGHKRGSISDSLYTDKYLCILTELAELAKENGAWLFKALYSFGQRNDNTITFLCFCRDGAFCHTYILIDWLCAEYPNHFKKGVR